MVPVAAFTTRHTFVAEAVIAARAVVIAIAAHCRLALLASPPLVVTDRGPAVRALHTVPIGQRDIRAAGVVGLQQVGDDHKEIEQPALQ